MLLPCRPRNKYVIKVAYDTLTTLKHNRHCFLPNGNLWYRNKPICVVIVKYPWLSAATVICLCARDKSNLVNDSPLASAAKTSSGVGRGYVGTFKCGLMVTLKSAQICSFLSFLVTTTIGVAQSLWSTGTSSLSVTCCCRVCSTWLCRLNGIGRDLQNLGETPCLLGFSTSSFSCSGSF